jgi:hypothetical protein
MTDYKHKRKSAASRLLAGYGAVKPVHKPEDWRKVREEMEAAVAEEVVAEDRSDEIPSPYLQELMKRADEDRKTGNTSPEFDNAEDLIEWLHKQVK